MKDFPKIIKGLEKSLTAARQQKLMIAGFKHDGKYDREVPNPYGIPLEVVRHAFMKGSHMKETKTDNGQYFEVAASKAQWETYWIERAVLLSKLKKYDDTDEVYRPEKVSPLAMVKKGYIPLFTDGIYDLDDLETIWKPCDAIACCLPTKN